VTTQLYIDGSGLQVFSSKRVVEVVLDAVFNPDSSASMGLSIRILFSELRIKLTCCNDNSNGPSAKSWTDKGVETSELVEGDQETSERLKSPKTIIRSLSER